MMQSIQELLKGIKEGDFIALARSLTLVENDIEPAEDLLKLLAVKDVPVVGITGPPGAGKSTLVAAVVETLVEQGKKIAILAIDPTSPFNFGSLLGDRIRMSTLFNHPGVYIRSVATRGALGGISAKTIEMVDVLKSSDFDLILIETVGVGQSEVEIAGLADKTVVVLVPEAGDEIQNIKSGLMEIAQAFVVNKSDREGADTFANNLNKLLHQQHQHIPVFKTAADKKIGIEEVCRFLAEPAKVDTDRRAYLLADKAFKIIQHRRMTGVDKKKLRQDISEALDIEGFNLYQFLANWD